MDAAASSASSSATRGPALRIARAAPSPEAAALRARAAAALQAGREDEAEALLGRCLEAAPDYAEARGDLALLLVGRNRLTEAVTHAEALLARDPGNPAHLCLKASIVSRLGRHDQAVALYAAALATDRGQPGAWISLGHSLKTLGRLMQAVAAYREALELAPHMGEAWWSLANLKTMRFTVDDIAAMERSLGAVGLTDEDLVQIHYALGKAREDEGEYAESFRHYARGAALRRHGLRYAADELSEHVRRSKAVFTKAALAGRTGQGSAAPDPIFVVGLPRAGSTLVEQILASHSQVEGTHELPDIMALARRLGGGDKVFADARYPEAMLELSPEALRALGEEYLDRARPYRLEGRPFFIDKMPNNFAHVGLIALALPNAKIIDVRRHPLGCGFSVFKQHFASGQAFSYDLADIGRWYADYVELMAHFDAVLPGRIHRVIYEALVADPEPEVRRLLEHCGLPFEASCLRFYENGRAVRTPSSEQVRQPIFAGAAEHWRNFEPWLEPLKASLGPVLAAYPDAPSRPVRTRRPSRTRRPRG